MSSLEPRSGEIETNGVRLHYLDWGGNGAPIIILHATGFLGRIYRPIAEALRAVGHVYSYDQRGHGDSGRPEKPSYEWVDSMNDLAGFIDAMGLKGARGFGHSAGATAIGALASEHPDLITRAVLVEPVIFDLEVVRSAGWQNPLYERTIKRRSEFASVDAMFENFERKPPYASWRPDILRDYCEFGTFINAAGRRELKCAPQVEAEFYRSSRNFDGLGRILKCAVPLLVLFGESGDSPGAVFAPRLRAQLKNGRVVMVADAGHFIPMEKPDYVARLAVEFLAAP